MAAFKGSQTEKNLQAALEGESIARNKYTYFAAKAREEGLADTAELFERMAQNESFHAKKWYEMLHGSIESTNPNLQNAMQGENGEWRSMYPSFAEQAEKEGFPQIADMFRKIADIEMHHEQAFMTEFIRLNTQGGAATVAKQPEPKMQEVWRCTFCGHMVPVADSLEAPVVCPVCGAIGAYERVMASV